MILPNSGVAKKNWWLFFLVLFMKIDKVVTIYSEFRFDYHKGKQPGMVDEHLPLKWPHSLTHYGIFKTPRHVKC